MNGELRIKNLKSLSVAFRARRLFSLQRIFSNIILIGGRACLLLRLAAGPRDHVVEEDPIFKRLEAIGRIDVHCIVVVRLDVIFLVFIQTNH